MKLGKVSGAFVGLGRAAVVAALLLSGGTMDCCPAHCSCAAKASRVYGTWSWVFILQLIFNLTLSRDLEACMVDSFALEMLPELVLDAGFFVLVLNFVFTSFLRRFLASLYLATNILANTLGGRVLVDNDGLGYGLDRSTNLWVHGRDILRDIFGHNSLHEEFGINFCNEIFEFIHQYGEIGIDVISIGRNNGFGADLEFTREIEFEKDFILEDFESFVGSVVEENSSGVKNSLTLFAGRQSSPAGRQSGRRGESRAAERCAGAAEHF
ncbi:hypothetical protein Tco_0762921 [Tanacetum coccineum]